jgi:hypothetical protein|tara:strand:- start:2483 stop:3118 length:636 start_codon:yes stop_codon:yes gene_type:complete
MADAQTGVFCINTVSSRIHNLASGNAIQYMQAGSVEPVKLADISEVASITGIVFALPGCASIGTLDTGPLKDGTALWTTSATSQIGDPAVSDYSFTSGDVSVANKAGGNRGTERIANGSAQKFVNAILDGAYRSYTSGVDQGSGITSMTVSRGDLSLSNTAVTDGTGVVNTYTRSYTVNFKYYQSGAITSPDNGTAARPDLAADGSDGVPF